MARKSNSGIKLNKFQYELLEYFSERKDLQIRANYSGRGMYGESCVGFTGNIDEFSIGFSLASFFQDELSETDEDGEEYKNIEALINLFKNSSSSIDSMGLDRILYFPRVQIGFDLEDKE